MKKFFKTLGKIIAGILILALLLVIALAVIPLTEKVPTAPAAGAGDQVAVHREGNRPQSLVEDSGVHLVKAVVGFRCSSPPFFLFPLLFP